MSGKRRRHQRAPDPIPDLEVQEPEVRWQEIGVTVRVGDMWPVGVPLPDVYLRQRPMPCPECMAVFAPGDGRAAVLVSSRTSIVYMRCKVCGHRWKLPVREI